MSSNAYIPPLPWDLDMLPFVTYEDKAELPPCPAIYFVRSFDTLLYLGATVNLHNRFAGHQQHKAFIAQPEITIAWMPIGVRRQARTYLLGLETQCFEHYTPTLNKVEGLLVRKESFLKEEPFITPKLKGFTKSSRQPKSYRIGVFAKFHQDVTFWTAYVNNYQGAWDKCCIHEVEAYSADDAKSRAIAACQAHRPITTPKEA